MTKIILNTTELSQHRIHKQDQLNIIQKLDRPILENGEIAYCIRLLFNYIFDAEFCAEIIIERPTKNLIVAKIGIPNIDKPLVIAGEMDEFKFLKFAKELIKNMNVDGLYFYKVNRELLDEQYSETEHVHNMYHEPCVNFNPKTCKIII